MDQGIVSMLAVGLGLGMLHAFDADHIVAVSSLASRGRDWRAGFTYALKWAMGHGGVLMLVAMAALLASWQLPPAIALLAEKMVGVILIITGISIFWSFQRQRVRLKIHRHGEVLHAHLASSDHPNNHDHTPVLVGVVHGLAGSAPALALIPAALYQPGIALGYIVIFSLGVLAGMASFGLLFGRCQRFLLARSSQLYDGSRLLLSACATGLGVFWLTTG
jgi:hypothetical protein